MDIDAGKCGPVTPIKVSIPARIHYSVLDMNLFSPGSPGGGGIGYAIDLRARVTVEPSTDVEIVGDRKGVIHHQAMAFKEQTGCEEGFRITAEDHGVRHLGMGSTSALSTAVLAALNASMGRPLDHREIRLLLGINFVEDHPGDDDDGLGGLVVPGFETGVGPAAGLYGGMVVMTDRLEIAGTMRFPDGLKVVAAVIAEEGEGNAGEDEVQLLMNRARELDLRDSGIKSRTVLLEALPAMFRNDLVAFSTALEPLQELGSKIAEIEHHSAPDRIREAIDLMRSNGGLMAGMSSVGPTVACLLQENRCEDLIQSLSDELPEFKIRLMDPDPTGLFIEDR